MKDKKVVVIGAGNVGMDVASQAYNCGAESVIAVDIQKPAAFGKEMEMAQSKARRSSGRSLLKNTEKGKKIYFKDGTSLEADVVVISIGDVPIRISCRRCASKRKGLD